MYSTLHIMSTKSQSSGETNTFALTLLVLFTVFVLVTAFSGGDANAPAADQSSAAAATNTQDQQGNTDDIEGLIGIPVDDSAVVENRTVSRPNGEGSEQVITFQSSLRAPDILREYQDWIQENDYTLEQERIGTRAASLAATNGNQVLIIMISYLSSQDASHVEIINYSRL